MLYLDGLMVLGPVEALKALLKLYQGHDREVRLVHLMQ